MSKLAIATKDALRVWKIAAKDNNRSAINHVHLDIVGSKDGKRGYLVATDGYQLIKREIELWHHVDPQKVNLPRDAVMNAEKVMTNEHRAHIYDDQIVIVKVIPDEATQSEDFQRVAVVPFVQQTSLNFPDYQELINKYADSDLPERIVKLDSKLLRSIIDQFKDGSFTVWVEMRLKESDEGTEPIILTANENLTNDSITAVVMPAKGAKSE